MIMSNNFFITRKEFPNDESVISSALLIKSGMIYKNDNGIYTYLPMGLKVINNIKNIIREEMKKINCDELLMPSLIKSDVFEVTNREKIFGSELFSIKNRDNIIYNLCPTSEELFALLARDKVRSYKDLHFTVYQISNKYRDEDLGELTFATYAKHSVSKIAFHIMQSDLDKNTSSSSLDARARERFQKWFDESDLKEWVLRMEKSHQVNLEIETLLNDFFDNDFIVRENCERGERMAVLKHFQNWLPKYIGRLKQQNTQTQTNNGNTINKSGNRRVADLGDIAQSILAGCEAGLASRR